MVKFTLKQCSYFIAVAENGGIAQAARVMNISQPAIAQAIDKLESITSLQLFDRQHARGMDLTVQGRAFYKEARKLILTAQTVERNVVDISANLKGTLRLGCFQSIAPFHVARLSSTYQTLYPNINIEVHERLQNELVTELLNGKIDLAILYDLGLDPSLLSWNLLSQPKPYVIVPKNHSKSAQTSISLKDLADEPYVLFDAPGSREYFYSIFARYQITPHIAFRSTSFESVRSAVGHGLGFSLLTMRRNDANTYDGHQVVTLEIKEDIDPTQIVLAHKQGLELPPLLSNFINYCVTDFVSQ
ncbi:LysR family transcriptional regulator [Kiloniella antarctica]|uniref:LysR family transcriptional regulator n=1 Tax=Kiloniella antarctica TaxID=1550907 RepID=A0ABW5BJJ7_9PROT